jgi:hypothetical protein
MSIKPWKCPNCGADIGADKTHGDGCVLGALLEVVRDRGNLRERTVATRGRRCDVDALWDDLGTVVDKLEDGGYSLPSRARSVSI